MDDDNCNSEKKLLFTTIFKLSFVYRNKEKMILRNIKLNVANTNNATRMTFPVNECCVWTNQTMATTVNELNGIAEQIDRFYNIL